MFEKLLGEVFDETWEGDRAKRGREQYEERRRDFVFHMTDWLSDFEELSRLYRHPDKADPEKVCIFMIGCVSHMTGHLNAACRLLLDEASDPFAPAVQPRKGKPRKARQQNRRFK